MERPLTGYASGMWTTRARVAAALAALVLAAMPMAACGDNDDGGAGDESGERFEGPRPSREKAPEEQQQGTTGEQAPTTGE